MAMAMAMEAASEVKIGIEMEWVVTIATRLWMHSQR
jgi:hypothetical protein